MDVDSLVDAVILQSPDHLEAGPVADVGQAGVAVTAEIPLKDPAVFGAVEQSAPGFELPDPVRRLFGVEFGHPPVVDVLAAAKGIGEVNFPVVAVVDVPHRGRHASLGHDRVGLAEKGLADEPDGDAARGGFDRGAEAGATGADHQDVVVVGLQVSHQKILTSVQIPIEQSRT